MYMAILDILMLPPLSFIQVLLKTMFVLFAMSIKFFGQVLGADELKIVCAIRLALAFIVSIYSYMGV